MFALENASRKITRHGRQSVLIDHVLFSVSLSFGTMARLAVHRDIEVFSALNGIRTPNPDLRHLGAGASRCAAIDILLDSRLLNVTYRNIFISQDRLDEAVSYACATEM